MIDFTLKERYGIGDLLEIVRLLRSPGGCPWDREQDHHTIRKNLIEETYEVAEAIDENDSVLLREELGDLLLQVALHAQMEDERGAFCFADVCNDICQKLIIRHPHVFGEVQAETSGEVLKNWDAIKQKQKGQNTFTQTLESVPKTLPALMRADKVQRRAAKAGMDYTDIEWTLGDLQSELAELQEALGSGDRAACLEEAGDVLFSAVNVARFLGADAEELLGVATEKFMRRFARVEALVRATGVDMQECGIDRLNDLWAEVKAQEE